MALGTVLRRGGHSADATGFPSAQSHRLLERLGVTDMSYLFNYMVNFNADISALKLTGHITCARNRDCVASAGRRPVSWYGTIGFKLLLFLSLTS